MREIKNTNQQAKVCKVAYKYRFRPNKEQEAFLAKTFGCSRWVYNNALGYIQEQNKKKDGEKIFYSYNEASKRLTALKKYPDLEWLKEPSSCTLQQSLRHLEKAFRNIKKTGSGYPKFKSKHNSRQSASFVGNAFRWNPATKEITLAKMKSPLNVSWQKNKQFSGMPSSVTVSRESTGKYYISFLVETVKNPLPVIDKTVGIDLGIKQLVVCSDSREFENIKALKMLEDRKENAQRKLSRLQGSKKGEAKSSRYRKAQQKLAKIEESIRNIRMDNRHKITKELVRNNQVICTETLKVKNMMKNHKLAKALADASFGEIIRCLKYKSEWAGRLVSPIDTFFASSKQCFYCGEKYSEKENNNQPWSLDVRNWKCVCGKQHNRDRNAARNIEREGLKLLDAHL